MRRRPDVASPSGWRHACPRCIFCESSARYTALLVARGDDDEFRREDLAQSKDNSTAYSSGSKKLACSTCGETAQTANRRNAGTYERIGRTSYWYKKLTGGIRHLTIPPTGREIGHWVGRVCLSASQLPTRPRETS